MITKRSQRSIAEALEYVIALFTETNRGYNASREYRKALKEFTRQFDVDNEGKENTLEEKISGKGHESKTIKNKKS